MARELGGPDRVAAQAPIAANERRHLRLALLGFERAGAIDQRAARLEQRDGVVEQTGLQGDELLQIDLGLQPWNIRMAADRAGR